MKRGLTSLGFGVPGGGLETLVDSGLNSRFYIYFMLLRTNLPIPSENSRALCSGLLHETTGPKQSRQSQGRPKFQQSPLISPFCSCPPQNKRTPHVTPQVTLAAWRPTLLLPRRPKAPGGAPCWCVTREGTPTSYRQSSSDPAVIGRPSSRL